MTLESSGAVAPTKRIDPLLLLDEAREMERVLREPVESGKTAKLPARRRSASGDSGRLRP